MSWSGKVGMGEGERWVREVDVDGFVERKNVDGFVERKNKLPSRLVFKHRNAT